MCVQTYSLIISYIYFFFLIMLRPPRSTLFPYTSSSDLHDIGHADGLRAALTEDVVVELEQVDPLHAETFQAGVERVADGATHVTQVRSVQTELRADVDRRSPRAQCGAEVLLRLSVAVRGRGVEVVDPQLHRPRNRALPLGRSAADHEPADVSAAEPERRHPQPCLAQLAVLHGSLL